PGRATQPAGRQPHRGTGEDDAHLAEQVPPEDDRGEPCPALRAPGGQARIGQRGQAAVPFGPVRRGGGGAGHGSSLGSPPGRTLGRGGGCDRRRTACRPGAQLSVQRNQRTTASTPTTAQARSTSAEPGEKVPEASQARSSSPRAPEGRRSASPPRIRGEEEAGKATQPTATSSTNTRFETASTASVRNVPATSRPSAPKATVPVSHTGTAASRPGSSGRQPMISAMTPSTSTWSTCVARVARILPARYPPRPSGVVATQRSTPLRRSKPVMIACEVKEVEIRAVAKGAATAVSIAATPSSRPSGSSHRPISTRAGRAMATISC